MTSLPALLSLWVLAIGCAATESRDADDALQTGKVDASSESPNTEDAAAGLSGEVCCGDGFSCCNGACAPDTLVQDWCASRGDAYGLLFRRGEDGCFALGFRSGHASATAYAYTVAGDVRSCSQGYDGLASKVDGDVDFCPGDAGYGCIVCAVDGPGVDLENWLEVARWCDESDDLPFSLQGVDRDGTGAAAE